MYDDYDDDGCWGYDGDPAHDMWTDYTSDMYERSDYPGECPDVDDDWGDVDPDFDYDLYIDLDGVADYDKPRDYGRYDSHGTCASAYAAAHHNDLERHMSIYEYESRIHHLEAMLAGAVAAAALLDARLADASSAQNAASAHNRISARSSDRNAYSAKASTGKGKSAKISKDAGDISKLRSGAESKREEISRYQAELDKLKSEYEPLKIQSERRRTRTIAIVCAAVCLIAILIAVL